MESLKTETGLKHMNHKITIFTIFFSVYAAEYLLRAVTQAEFLNIPDLIPPTMQFSSDFALANPKYSKLMARKNSATPAII